MRCYRCFLSCFSSSVRPWPLFQSPETLSFFAPSLNRTPQNPKSQTETMSYTPGLRVLAVATVLAQIALAFVPSTSPLSSSPSSSRQTSSRLHVGNVNLDFYPGLRGLFDMGNIILDEVRAGRSEAQQEVAEITGWVAEKVGIQQHQQVLIQQQPVVLHPVFGELVKDLVYKKIYCTSVQKLATIPIWEQQRIYRAERAQLLANDIKAKLRDGKALTLPGSLTVYEMGDKIGLLDGQHRLGALKMLMESDVLIPEAHLILVEVFPVKAEEEVKRLFTEINTAQPVSIIDMPDMADATEKDIITQACEMLRLEYADMFKPSSNCRLPHVNIDVLRDNLFKSNVVGRTGAGTAEQLVEWIKAKNDVVTARDDALWQTAYKGRNAETVAKAVGKARNNKFFLGMEPNWMEVE